MQHNLELFLKEKKPTKTKNRHNQKSLKQLLHVFFYPFYNTRQHNLFFISYYVMKMVTEKSSYLSCTSFVGG